MCNDGGKPAADKPGRLASKTLDMLDEDLLRC
jgi:hypothetical protein